MVKTINYKLATIFILLGSVLFGGGYVVSVIGLGHGLTPLELIAGRMFIASVLLNIIFFKKIITNSPAEIIAGIILGITMFGAFTFQKIGLQYTTASISAFISSIYVVIIPFIHWMYYKKAPDRFSNMGAVLTIIGVGFISLNDGLYISLGITLTLICAVFNAVQIFSMEIYNKKFDPIKLTVTMMNTCFIASFLLTIYLQDFYSHQTLVFEPVNIAVLFYLGIMSTILPFLLQNIGQKYVSATKASLMMSTEAIFGTLFSIIVFSEALNAQMIIGCFLIIAAIVIAETKLQFKD